jgi:uncharacterized protein YbjT (DUF2867 family)
MILVIGATGALGSTICSLLAQGGRAVRGLIRPNSAPGRVAALRALAIETVEGDLKQPASLAPALAGVRTVISTATSTMSRTPGDTVETVDLVGTSEAVASAERAGVDHFIFVSFHPFSIDFPLQAAKRVVEARLRSSRAMAHTILQPTMFCDTWLTPMMGFDVSNSRATVYGDGQARQSWISLRDVGRAVVAAVDNPRARNQTIELGGPEALSVQEVAERLAPSAGPVKLNFVRADHLRSQFEGAADPAAKSFAGLLLGLAAGYQIDPGRARSILGMKDIENVNQWSERVKP